MQENIAKPVIYISYAWNPESYAIAESIEKEFGEKGVCGYVELGGRGLNPWTVVAEYDAFQPDFCSGRRVFEQR